MWVMDDTRVEETYGGADPYAAADFVNADAEVSAEAATELAPPKLGEAEEEGGGSTMFL